VFGVALSLCACGGGSAQPPEDSESWQVAIEGLPGALISVAGTSKSDIWFAGADPGDGVGPLVLHYDGDSLTRYELALDSIQGVDLWWVRAFAPDDVYFGGTQGTIIRYNGATFTRLPTPAEDTVFGIWGADANEVWAVGGNPSLEGKAFVWHSDEGGSFAPAEMLPQLGLAAYFKVWGRSPEELVIVGTNGTILRGDAGVLSKEESPTSDQLTTVHVSAGNPYVAVGGFGDGVILEDDGAGWRDRTPTPAPRRLFGVWLSGEDGVAVGSNGTLVERHGSDWQQVPNELRVTLDLHAAFIDDEGGAWAVGGDLVSTPKVDGLILYKGPRELPNDYRTE
jgi:hypothetical protein